MQKKLRTLSDQTFHFHSLTFFSHSTPDSFQLSHHFLSPSLHPHPKLSSNLSHFSFPPSFSLFSKTGSLILQMIFQISRANHFFSHTHFALHPLFLSLSLSAILFLPGSVGHTFAGKEKNRRREKTDLNFCKNYSSTSSPYFLSPSILNLFLFIFNGWNSEWMSVTFTKTTHISRL